MRWGLPIWSVRGGGHPPGCTTGHPLQPPTSPTCSASSPPNTKRGLPIYDGMGGRGRGGPKQQHRSAAPPPFSPLSIQPQIRAPEPLPPPPTPSTSPPFKNPRHAPLQPPPMPMPAQGRCAPPGPPQHDASARQPRPSPCAASPSLHRLPLCRSAALLRCAAPRAGGPRAAPSTRAHAAPRTCVCTAHVERGAWSWGGGGGRAWERGDPHPPTRARAWGARGGAGHVRVHAFTCACTLVHAFTCERALVCASVHLAACARVCFRSLFSPRVPPRDRPCVRADAHTRVHAPTRVCSLTRTAVRCVRLRSEPRSPALTHARPAARPPAFPPHAPPHA